MMIKLKNEEEQKAPGQNGMDGWMEGRTGTAATDESKAKNEADRKQPVHIYTIQRRFLSMI